VATDLPGDDMSGGSDCEGGADVTLFLDGAHTPESSLACARCEHGGAARGFGRWTAHTWRRRWFCEASASGSGEDGAPIERVLIFNCGQDREAEALLAPLAHTLRAQQVPLAFAVFVPPTSSYTSLTPNASAHANLAWQQSNARIWDRVYKPAAVHAGGAATAAQSSIAKHLGAVPIVSRRRAVARAVPDPNELAQVMPQMRAARCSPGCRVLCRRYGAVHSRYRAHGCTCS